MFKNYKQLIGYIGALIICGSLPIFIHSPYYLDLLILIFVHAVLAICFTLNLKAGLLNLGLAAFWGMGAYISAVLTLKLQLPFWFSLPIAGLATGAIAYGIGYFLLVKGRTGFTFVLLSSVIGMLFSVLVGGMSYLGGYNGMTDIPAPNSIPLPFLPPIEFTSQVPFFYLVLFLFVVIVLICKAFYSSWTGRAWQAIALNPRLAESLGVNLFQYRLLSFVLSSAIAGLIGSFHSSYAGFVIPSTYNMWVNIDIQVYAILGGMGYVIAGPLLGSTVMTLFPEFIRGIYEYAPIFTGTLLILLIMFLPTGLLGLWDKRGVISTVLAKFGYRRKNDNARHNHDTSGT